MTELSGECPIWKTPAKANERSDFTYEIDSPRAGGEYLIGALIYGRGDIQSLRADEKARLTTWLVEQRRFGEPSPEVTKDVLEAVLFAEMESIHLLNDRNRDAVNEVAAFFGHFVERKWLKKIIHHEMRGVDLSTYTITLEGHFRLEELEHVHVPSSQAFVAMWFDDSVKRGYAKGIKPGIEDAGYRPFRVDQAKFNDKIDDEIIAQIRRSRFLVADFTQGDDGARGGVYYEAGFAHGLGIPVIFTCHENSLGHLHFDTRQYNHIVWEDPEQFRRELMNRICATVGDGPGKTVP